VATRQARRIHAALDALYRQLPEITCKGDCADSCTAIGMTACERSRIRAKTGIAIPNHAPRGYVNKELQAPVCPALTPTGQCAVYNLRPMICRLWGLTREMQCSYGCEPVGGYVPLWQAYEWIAEAYRITGDEYTARMYRTLAANPEVNRYVRRTRDPVLALERRAHRDGLLP